MPSKRMLPHAVVIQNYTGENSTGEAQYIPAYLAFVYIETMRKVSKSGVSLNPADQIRLFVFDTASLMTDISGSRKAFVSPEQWKSMTAGERAAAWTMQDGKDKIEYGDDTYMITSVERYDGGSRRARHWEVYGK